MLIILCNKKIRKIKKPVEVFKKFEKSKNLYRFF